MYLRTFPLTYTIQNSATKENKEIKGTSVRKLSMKSVTR